MEKRYIGTKIIAAEPMDEAEFFANQGKISATNRAGYKVRYEDGYVSWSPKETFDRAYREITNGELKLLF